jgi:hypothetical protein
LAIQAEAELQFVRGYGMLDAAARRVAQRRAAESYVAAREEAATDPSFSER